MCPLLATTECTHSNGYVNFGSIASPMVYFMQCDNDNLYTNTCQWASTGTFYGLMILYEAEMQITGGNNGTTPNVMGAVLEGCPANSTDTGTDLTLTGNSSICYNPHGHRQHPSQQHPLDGHQAGHRDVAGAEGHLTSSANGRAASADIDVA